MSIFYVLQGIAATYLSCGRKYGTSFVANFLESITGYFSVTITKNKNNADFLLASFVLPCGRVTVIVTLRKLRQTC